MIVEIKLNGRISLELKPQDQSEAAILKDMLALTEKGTPVTLIGGSEETAVLSVPRAAFWRPYLSA